MVFFFFLFFNFLLVISRIFTYGFNLNNHTTTNRELLRLVVHLELSQRTSGQAGFRPMFISSTFDCFSKLEGVNHLDSNSGITQLKVSQATSILIWHSTELGK
ncbi:hypothetical protein EDC96DRAFT_548311 [Choanephora cucurbitarum]|nr:hypothetical protein EDC96DRAFT_548311 [Choanephora cucurbitarum]